MPRIARPNRTWLAAALALTLVSMPGASQAQDATEQALERYRQMMKADPWANPALLDADRGAALWRKRQGPRNTSLEACDLGKGAGVVDGAFAELPRYFPDADRVMDVETRLLWCMEKLQGVDPAAFRRDPHPASGAPVKDIGAIATWIATRSAGQRLNASRTHPREADAVELGAALFQRRSGPFDFACATCHADTGKRIRLQPLPHLSNPLEARKVMGEWPAYRVSSAHVMTLQHRLMDCYWQMRLHRLEFGSEASVALAAYLADKARGATVAAPSIKR